jgi:hypothetical protein
MSVVPTREQQGQLADLAYRLDQARQDLLWEGAGATPARKAAAAAVITDKLAELSRWMDANPNVRMDNSGGDDDDDDDTLDIAIFLAISTDPASIPLYRKMVERQPDILKKKFAHDMTLEDYISQTIEFDNPDVAGRKVLMEKLNPGRAEMVKMDRLFGKVGDDRKTNPLPRDVQLLVREQLTGKPIKDQMADKTKRGGRRKTRKTRRKARKTKRATRKTK